MLARMALFLGLWLILAGFDPGGLVFGLVAAALATWASLRLMPGRMSLAPWAALRLAGLTLWQSLLAGVDIAWRAFDPRLPLQPGLVAQATALAPGAARDGFTALASLAPGALPSGTDAEGALVIHALDTRLPIARNLSDSEALYRRAAGHG